MKYFIKYGFGQWRVGPKLYSHWSNVYQKYFARRAEITIDHQCLFLGRKLKIAPNFREEIIKEIHKQHLGLLKAKATMKQYYWWPNMDSEVELLIHHCQSCAENQKGRAQIFRILETKHMKQASIWTCTYRLFWFRRENIIFMIDSLSRWIQVEMVRGSTVQETIRKLENMFNNIGWPTTIVSEFLSMCAQNEIKVIK